MSSRGAAPGGALEVEADAGGADDTAASDSTAGRLRALREFADGARTLPILIQTEPDPDAIASGFAVRVLLGRSDRTAPIVSLGHSRRPETRRMIDLLDMQVTEITQAELESFERVVVVDTHPGMLSDADTRVAVIDHHPGGDDCAAEFQDVRPEFGAAATMLTEYLRADGQKIGERLATALLYGIRTDTALLTRGCTRADVEAYAYLQERADLALLNRIDRPAYPRDALPQLGRALGRAQLRDDLAVLWLGRVTKSRAHLMPELADLSLNIEGVRWVVAAGVVERALVLNIRYLAESDPGAGTLARQVAKSGGSGGGHATMARVEIPLEQLPVRLDDEGEEAGEGKAAGDPQGIAAGSAREDNAARLADWLEGEVESVRRAARGDESAVAAAS